MKTEGREEVAPAPVKITLDMHEARILKNRAVEQAKERDYVNRRGRWAIGLRKGVNDKNVGWLARAERPPYAGSLGHYAAACIYLGRMLNITIPMDLERRPLGDQGIDLELYGLTMQFKTRQNDRPVSYIRCIDEWGRPESLPAMTFIFCEWTGGLDVLLLGWVWSREIRHRSPVPAIVGDHMNIEVEDRELLPMNRLVKELKNRKGRV